MAKMTRAQYNKLRERLDYLKGEKLEEVEEELKKAREERDLRENSRFEIAQRALLDLKDSISQTEETLNQADIIEINYTIDDRVNLGSRVKMRIDGAEVIEKIFTSEGVEGAETSGLHDFMNTISDTSIVGKAISGKRNGDKVTYYDMLGKEHTIEILRVV